jgi:hypothetical protein
MIPAMSKFPPCLAALAFCVLVFPLAAAPLAEETFKNISGDGPEAVTGELTWKKIANVTLGGTTASKGGGSALQADFIPYGKFYVTFPSAEIPVGGALRATLQLRYVTAPESAVNALRIGLENLSDPENPANTDGQPGYLLFINPGGDAATGNAFAVETGTDGSMGGGKDFQTYGAGFPSVAFGTEPHTITFTIARTESGVDTSVKFDDLEATTATETTVQAKTFNALLVAVGNVSSASIVVEKAVFELLPPGKN